MFRIEGGRAERDGKTPIMRQAFAGEQCDPLDLLGAQALYRVTVDCSNGTRHVWHRLGSPPVVTSIPLTGTTSSATRRAIGQSSWPLGAAEVLVELRRPRHSACRA